MNRLKPEQSISVAWSNGWHSFEFDRPWISIWVLTITMLTAILHGIPQLLQANDRIVPQIMS
jgi:hypothetical protein